MPTVSLRLFVAQQLVFTPHKDQRRSLAVLAQSDNYTAARCPTAEGDACFPTQTAIFGTQPATFTLGAAANRAVNNPHPTISDLVRAKMRE